MSGTSTGKPLPPALHPAAGPGERLAAEMAEAWRRGDCLPVDAYLDRHPELLDPPEEVIRLIYEEVCLRQERGEEVTIDELQRRFPRWAGELSVMLDCHRLVRARLGPSQFPTAGESLGDFLLIAELGRGRQARVFLATQPTLADRPVVLKVTPRQDCEFLSLARLQHTHIIPLHGVHDFPARNLRALCLPYLGGATLARLLDLLGPVAVARRTGRSLVDALDQARAGAPLLGSRRVGNTRLNGPRDALAKASYPEAVCWIGAALADALQYAHERDLVHLDLKPSNVLLAADGQPLLLDFHLALHPLPVGQAAPEGLGGTLEYMSPEQRAAYAAARVGLPVPVAVDGRSDICSLGRLLYTALAGTEPSGGPALPPLSRCNPGVSVGLADVIARCLAPDPTDRYPDAAALAADLRRHLAELPLRGVPNRSLRERWRKWRRRRPSALLWASLLLALSAGPAALGTVVLERIGDAREALREGQEQFRRRAYAEAARTLARGKARVDGWPGCQGLLAELEERHRRAQRASAVEQLHTVCERLRLLAGGDVLAGHHLRTLEAHCQTAWQARGLVAGHADTPLDNATEEQARADLIDLALLWTDLKQRLMPGDPTARAEGRKVLAEAESLCGPTAAPARERRVALARALLRAGELDQAAVELERAVELRPQDFWAHFYRGVCAHRRGRPSEAVQAFDVAVALAPAFPEVYHNRALAYAVGGKTAAALRDYDRALALAPTLAASALNRGVLHYTEGRHPLALADLERALRQGAEPAATHYNLALVHHARGDPAAARQHLERVLSHQPAHAEARSLLERLRPR